MTQEQEQEPGAYKEEPRRFTLALFIVHPSLTPEEIEAALGLEEHYVHPVGAPRQTPKGTPLPGRYPDTRWRHCVLHSARGQYFARQLAAFAESLKPHRSFLRRIRNEGGETCLILAFLGDGHLADNLPSETLATLADLGLDLGIESYMEPQSVGPHVRGA